MLPRYASLTAIGLKARQTSMVKAIDIAEFRIAAQNLISIYEAFGSMRNVFLI